MRGPCWPRLSFYRTDPYLECRSSEHAKKLAVKPLSLPWELQQPDRRALDLAVFELLGVADAAERERLCDELYREVTAHFRQIRIVEIQKQEQRSHAEGREFRTDELAADLANLLLHWLVHGKPERRAPVESTSKEKIEKALKVLGTFGSLMSNDEIERLELKELER
jgi:hypothetical protein